MRSSVCGILFFTAVVISYSTTASHQRCITVASHTASACQAQQTVASAVLDPGKCSFAKSTTLFIIFVRGSAESTSLRGVTLLSSCAAHWWYATVVSPKLSSALHSTHCPPCSCVYLRLKTVITAFTTICTKKSSPFATASLLV